MSTTAVGTRSTLLSVPGVLSSEQRGRWLNGVNMYGFPHADPWTWDPCSDGTFRVKPAESDVTTEPFDPFGVGMTFLCSRLGLTEDYRGRLEAAFNARISFIVEQAVSQGSDVSSNPSLGDTNLDILGGGAVTPAVALSFLEEAIGSTGLRGIIHAASPVVSAWGFEKVRVDGDHLVSPNGNYVAAGGGYIGADPASGSTPAAGQSWVFATTGLEVRMTEPTIPGNESETLDRSLNDVEVYVESTVLATWDHEVLQAGVLVDWTP
jgi:hypothetical protein